MPGIVFQLVNLENVFIKNLGGSHMVSIEGFEAFLKVIIANTKLINCSSGYPLIRIWSQEPPLLIKQMKTSKVYLKNVELSSNKAPNELISVTNGDINVTGG